MHLNIPDEGFTWTHHEQSWNLLFCYTNLLDKLENKMQLSLHFSTITRLSHKEEYENVSTNFVVISNEWCIWEYVLFLICSKNIDSFDNDESL